MKKAWADYSDDEEEPPKPQGIEKYIPIHRRPKVPVKSEPPKDPGPENKK